MIEMSYRNSIFDTFNVRILGGYIGVASLSLHSGDLLYVIILGFLNPLSLNPCLHVRLYTVSISHRNRNSDIDPSLSVPEALCRHIGLFTVSL